MNVRSKNSVRIFGVAAFCMTAANAWVDRAQQSAADEAPQRTIAEAPAGISHDPSAASINLDLQEAPALTSIKHSTAHPAYSGLDHPDSFHEAASPPTDGAIDACSLRCLSCHDGISAPETRVKTAGGWEMPFDTHRYFHPLGVSYDIACSGDSALTPRAFLPPQIILPEGKVGCESCHNLHSSMPHFLVTSNLGGALCLECHIK